MRKALEMCSGGACLEELHHLCVPVRSWTLAAPWHRVGELPGPQHAPRREARAVWTSAGHTWARPGRTKDPCLP